MFNSREYEWADITLILGGVDITGFTGIDFSAKQEKEVLKAKGYDGHSVQFGNKEISGTLTLTQSAKEALNKAGNGDLLTIRSITAVIVYGNPSTGIAPLTKTITGMSFTEDNDKWKQGDKFMECDIPFVALSRTTK